MQQPEISIHPLIGRLRLFDLNLEQKWYDYRDRAYERIAKEWCEKYNIDCCDIIT